MQKDERFKHVASDPKFRRLPQKDRKVKIDKRFQSMFQDSKFKVKSVVDKRGRPVNYASTENYKKYYELTSSSEDDDSEAEEKTAQKKVDKSKKVEVKRPEKDEESEEESDSSKEDDEDEEEENEDNERALELGKAEKKLVTSEVRQKLKDLSTDYARGVGQICSDSSSDDESSEEEGDEFEELEHEWGELDKDAERTEEASYRLAVCNMDWTRVRSEDLMLLLNSFLPAGGSIEKVMVFQSEFGKQCMKEEEVSGPRELSEITADETGEDNFDMEKLRKYELRRLKYFYAVVIFDSVATASHVYSECDGMEFESTSTKVDLRFIPDDLTFDEEPRDECDTLPEAGKYVPQFFTTGALTRSNFELTWDETDPRRTGINRRVWANKDKELDEDVIKTYLASSTDDESDNEKKSADVYKALLQEDEKEDNNKEMEITWGVDLQSKVDEKAAEKLRKESGLGALTPFEELMQKKKEKKKQKQLARKAKADASDDSEEEIVEGVPFSDDELPSDAEDIKRELMMDNEPKSKKKKGKGKKSLKKEEVVDEKKRAELELLMMDGDNERHFNFNTRVPKKAQTDDDFQVDVEDPRFTALFTSHHFNIDPSNPSFKSTKGTQALVNEKLKRRGNPEQSTPQKEEKRPTMSLEISNLVRSVKRKSGENKFGKSKLKKNQ
ncbi:ESF1 homolog [Neocloeon triangulifer]|uniref:ESF1 homolog n=1 Tax=Neocloeon triangulifer TaxID=2078957 RepID=UPI00286F6604|nr:ESF1 homolog [Neocloeon triangulifer]